MRISSLGVSLSLVVCTVTACSRQSHGNANETRSNELSALPSSGVDPKLSKGIQETLRAVNDPNGMPSLASTWYSYSEDDRWAQFRVLLPDLPMDPDALSPGFHAHLVSKDGKWVIEFAPKPTN